MDAPGWGKKGIDMIYTVIFRNCGCEAVMAVRARSKRAALSFARRKLQLNQYYHAHVRLALSATIDAWVKRHMKGRA